MKRIFAAAAAALVLASTPAYATSYAVDHRRSKLGFEVNWAGGTFEAAFKSWEAEIDFDPSYVSHSHVDVTIDLKSETSNDPGIDAKIKGPLGFDVAKYPTARFKSISFWQLGKSREIAVTGELTIHGITETVTLHCTLSRQNEKMYLRGTARVLRADFGLGTGDTSLAPTVDVAVDVWAAPGR